MENNADLPLEMLIKLRNEVGLKAFKEFHNSKSHKSHGIPETKRSSINKSNGHDAPLEISSKFPVKQKRIKAYKQLAVDPRFNDRCGKFNEEKFRKNYQFAFDLRDEEVEELKNVRDNDKKQQKTAKYLIQRMENQKREYNSKSHQPKSRHTLEEASDGTKFYVNKNLTKAKELVNKFKMLKNSGRLDKHLDKRRKKQSGKERKRMNIAK